MTDERLHELLEQWQPFLNTDETIAAIRTEVLASLNLDDPATENAVADAIRRLAPEGEYVALSDRYPWRFHEPTVGRQRVTLLDAVILALRASADVHDAERIPHLVGPLRALADQLLSGAIDSIRYEHLIVQIEAVWGPRKVEDALRLAVEAGKYALQLEQIGDLLREHAFLELAGALPKPGEGFVTWALRHGLTTQEQLEQGRALDLLGMRAEAEDLGEDG